MWLEDRAETDESLGNGIEKNRAEDVFNTVQWLRGVAINLTHDPDDANDLLGDVTLKLLPKQGSYTEQGTFSARVKTALINTFLDQQRKSKPVPLEDVPNLPNLSVWWWELSWPQNESYRDLGAVSDVMQWLSDTIRKPFELYLEGVHYEDIPQELGDPDRAQWTVRSQIYKARKKLRDTFPDLFAKYAPNPKGWKKQ